MEQNLNSKVEITDKFQNFYEKNKKKIYIFCSFLIIFFVSLTILNIKNENNNLLIAEKYVKAGMALSSGSKEKSLDLLEEIILSENSFYGILALNMILEKELISDKKRILNYFEILNKTKQSKENKDIINLKKALFLIKNSEIEDGKKILKEMIKNNSNLEFLAKEIIE